MRTDWSLTWEDNALAVVDTEEFTVAFLATVGLLLAVPTTIQWVRHLAVGAVAAGFLIGAVGLGIAVVCGSKLLTAHRCIRRRSR